MPPRPHLALVDEVAFGDEGEGGPLIFSEPLRVLDVGPQGVRAPPPRLLPINPHQGNRNLRTQELRMLEHLGLDSRVKPLAEGNAGGGVKVRPPPLKPVKLSPMDLERQAAAAEATSYVLDESAVNADGNGGGGVHVMPPRLLVVLVEVRRQSHWRGACAHEAYSLASRRPTLAPAPPPQFSPVCHPGPRLLRSPCDCHPPSLGCC